MEPIGSRQAAIVVGALHGVGEGGVGGVDAQELVGGGALHDVGMAGAGEPAISRLDLRSRSAGADAKDVVEGGGAGGGSGGADRRWPFRRGGVGGGDLRSGTTRKGCAAGIGDPGAEELGGERERGDHENLFEKIGGVVSGLESKRGVRFL